NPGENEINIQTNSLDKFSVQLFDITGNTVTSNYSFTSTATINVSSLSQGIYFLRITDAKGGLVKIQKVAVMK
ncbi:MAG: T9SS type A sorting domain-containing protein, partial [Bacteroidia bacterium]